MRAGDQAAESFFLPRKKATISGSAFMAAASPAATNSGVLVKSSHAKEETSGSMITVIIEPDVSSFAWDDFTKTPELVAAGEAAAMNALPEIVAFLRGKKKDSAA